MFLRMFVLLYADDAIVMAESAGDLQIALDAVREYCNLWHLAVNTVKTKIVILLGTTFSFNGSFDKAIKSRSPRPKELCIVC